MGNITDPLTQWAFVILLSVVMGTCLLMAVAIFRRWQQTRYIRYVHTLQRKYRPVLAEVLSGAGNASGISALRELPLADLELLLDPLFSKRKLTEQSLVFLQTLCEELGLVALWRSRLANGHAAAHPSPGNGVDDRARMRYLLRAKSIRNLGMLHHQPSWPLLVKALDDRHADIQLVALRSLAALGAPESFPMLREMLHAVVLGETTSPPLRGLQAAMVCYDLACAPALLPSLRHEHRQIRAHAIEILRMMVCREAARHPNSTLTPESLPPAMVDLLLSGLAMDPSADVRGRAAEVIVLLAGPCATPLVRSLLLDPQWFVRMRTVRALAHLRQAAAPLHLDIRDCLRDPNWLVREAATQTLIALGREGKHHLYEHFLISPDPTTREQIVEVIERTGLMSSLVQEYSVGTKGVDALMVEQMANDTALLGLSGILRTVDLEIHQSFMARYLPYEEFKMRFVQEAQSAEERAVSLQQVLDFPPSLAA
ncbi:MAG: HEAT repeat domain-containing protein [Terriglobia bacterium]